MIDVSTLRANLGWSQTQMAAYLGMSQAGVHYLENTGRLKLPVRMMLERLAAQHGIVLSDCAGGEISSAGVASPAGSDIAPPASTGDAEPCGGGSCA